jgi:hypothetical protein
MEHFKKRGSGSSVGMIMVQFEDSLCQRSEVQISIRSSYSEKIFYEKKKFDDLWAHYHGLHSQPSDTKMDWQKFRNRYLESKNLHFFHQEYIIYSAAPEQDKH